jgi:hypothetical protein
MKAFITRFSLSTFTFPAVHQILGSEVCFATLLVRTAAAFTIYFAITKLRVLLTQSLCVFPMILTISVDFSPYSCNWLGFKTELQRLSVRSEVNLNRTSRSRGVKLLTDQHHKINNAIKLITP